MDDEDDKPAKGEWPHRRRPATPDKPLTGRQELFAQNVARGLDLVRAYREAGFKGAPNVCRMRRLANVQARIAQLKAETAARTRLDIDQIVARLQGIADKAEAGFSAPMLSVGRATLIDLAKMLGFLDAKGQIIKPPPEPISEVRFVIVEPDGSEGESWSAPTERSV